MESKPFAADATEVDEEVGESVFNRIDSAIGPLDEIGGFMLATSSAPDRVEDVSLSREELTTIRRALAAVLQEIGAGEFELRGGVPATEALSLFAALG